VLWTLLVIVPVLFVALAAAQTPVTPMPVRLLDGTRFFTIMISLRHIHAAEMAAIASALLAGVTGLFIVTGSTNGDRRLVIAGYEPRQILAAHLGIIAGAAVVITTASLAVSAAFFAPSLWTEYAAAALIIALTYAMLGVVLGPVVGAPRWSVRLVALVDGRRRLRPNRDVRAVAADVGRISTDTRCRPTSPRRRVHDTLRTIRRTAPRPRLACCARGRRDTQPSNRRRDRAAENVKSHPRAGCITILEPAMKQTRPEDESVCRPSTHRGHGWMMLCCLAIVLGAATLVGTGTVGASLLLYAAGCVVMMALMMRLMSNNAPGTRDH
jgi:hypothetical protein